MADIKISSETLRFVDAAELRQLAEQAVASPRKRSHLLLHAGPEDGVQRLLIAAQPGTYLRPHRHSQQWELLALQSGSLDLATFDMNGKVLERKTLNQSATVLQIPASVWHSFYIREAAMLVEIKPGPFRQNEFSEWAPEEGHESVSSFLRWFASAAPQESWRFR